MDIKKAMVIGSGTMGAGIAQTLAQAGIQVYVNDIKAEFVERGIGGITKFLEGSVKKERLTAEQKEAILGNLIPSTDYADAKDVQIVIEAATENPKIKHDIFEKLDGIVPADAILASNTSSLSLTAIAAATKRPDKVVGMHFFNPAPIMKLIEVVRGLATSDETVEVVENLSKKLGKTPVVIDDSPAFVVNRVLNSMMGEAIQIVAEGLATPEEVDTAMKLGAGMPMGPLELADMVGLDISLAVGEVVYNGFSDSKYRIPPLLRKYVEAGWLGRKTGRGFYKYD